MATPESRPLLRLTEDLTSFRHYLQAERGMAENTVLAYGRDLDRFATFVASGGIRTYEDALRMIEAGADRLGTSNGVAIVTQQQNATSGESY